MSIKAESFLTLLLLSPPRPVVPIAKLFCTSFLSFSLLLPLFLSLALVDPWGIVLTSDLLHPSYLARDRDRKEGEKGAG